MLANANSVPNAGSPSRQRLSSAERRAAIVKAALELFSQNGFRGTTTRELASAVGVSEPVLYQHFTTKRELYNAIVDHMVEEGSRQFEAAFARLDPNGNDRQFFQRLGELIVDWYLEQTRHIRLLLFSALERHELAEMWHQRATIQVRIFVQQFIEKRLSEGAYRLADSALLARAFLGMVGHYGMVTAIFEQPEHNPRRDQVVAQFVDIFLNGISRTPPSGVQL